MNGILLAPLTVARYKVVCAVDNSVTFALNLTVRVFLLDTPSITYAVEDEVGYTLRNRIEQRVQQHNTTLNHP